MIYFMTSFFLWSNNAPTIWWAGFATVCIADMFIGFIKYENS